MARRNNKKYMWIGVTIGVVLLLALAGTFLMMATGDSEVYTFKDPVLGTVVVTFHNPFFGWFEQAAYVDQDTITLGDEICFNELTSVQSWMGCIERVEWEFQLNSQTIKTIGKDYSPPKCSGQITYSACWTPTKVGNWQIVSYYIATDGNVAAETASESYFVVEDKPDVPVCDSHDYQACSGNDLYWYDSCGDIEERAQRCDNGCQNNQCKPADPVCDQGQEKCSGFTLEVCNNNAWEQRGTQKNKCGVTCIDNSDCGSTYICNAQYTCEPSGQCPSGQTKCSDGTCKASCETPSPLPWVIIFLIIGVLVVAVIILIVWKLRRR